MTVYPASMKYLAALTSQVVEQAKLAGLSFDEIYDIEVAIDEAFVNILEHSYNGMSDGNIECTCRILPNGLEIVLVDTGCFFNPEDVPPPDLTSPLDERKSSGLGLYFMQQFMDKVVFDPCSEGGTRLTMIKYRKDHPDH